MNRPHDDTNSSSTAVYERMLGLSAKTVVVVMVVITVGAMSLSMAPIADAQNGTQTGGGNNASETFAVQQGDTCYTVTPMGDGTNNVVSYYDYRTHGSGYSSRGTTDLQIDDTSQFFFYKGNGGLSLVFLHDQFSGNRSTGGGTVTLVMRGMPVTGGWTVKDDGYAGANDTFTFNKSMTTASWGWNGGRNDGGVYRAPPDDWKGEITIDPKFNREAEHYPYSGWEGEGTMNQVERWIVRSGDEQAHALNMYEEVKITPGTCDSKGGTQTQQQDQGQGQSQMTSNQDSNDDSGGLRTIVSGPGFGVGLTVLALAVALVAIVARRRR
ncbi:hypothetical protein [Halocatena pleomorpha]|uniref:Cell surface glycoprotein related protein n=1 Tax=Halocatena pleomorpha TaxID=1785090 RepID=A0A3P3REZ3_9EURY|nr:hypothetical protein [Halocatena pleomorpha]RRJ32067.1 hypothetical protein EIK79_05940 [Halocatena pleomorpha]